MIGNSAITSNVAEGGFGGALNALVTVTDGNSYGGGLYAAGGSLSVRNGIVTGNAALGGGGLRLRRGISVPGNEGDGTGGGIYINPAASVGLDSLTVRNTKGNTASTSARNIFGDYDRIV